MTPFSASIMGFAVGVGACVLLAVILGLSATRARKDQLALLLAVAKLEPYAYGNTIIDAVGFPKFSYGKLYVYLERMERDGLVTSSYGPPLAERGNRPRRYWELTDAGREHVREGPVASAHGIGSHNAWRDG